MIDRIEELSAQAASAVNEVGENGPVHEQDTHVAHLTDGEIVIPKSAQTPGLMAHIHRVLGPDFPRYLVGSGQEQRNPTSGLPAFADDMTMLERGIRQDMIGYAGKSKAEQSDILLRIQQLGQTDPAKAQYLRGEIGIGLNIPYAAIGTATDAALEQRRDGWSSVGDVMTDVGVGATVAGHHLPFNPYVKVGTTIAGVATGLAGKAASAAASNIQEELDWRRDWYRKGK